MRYTNPRTHSLTHLHSLNHYSTTTVNAAWRFALGNVEIPPDAPDQTLSVSDKVRWVSAGLRQVRRLSGWVRSVQWNLALMQPDLTATGTHVPYGIIVLPAMPVTFQSLPPAEAGTHFSDAEGMQGCNAELT